MEDAQKHAQLQVAQSARFCAASTVAGSRMRCSVERVPVWCEVEERGSASNARQELETFVHTSHVLSMMLSIVGMKSEVILMSDESSGFPPQVGRCYGTRIERCELFVGWGGPLT